MEVKTHNETLVYTTPTKIVKLKRQTIPSIGKDVEKLEPSHIASGNVKMVQPLGKTTW